MAQREPVGSVEGYRTRDRDGVVFVTVGDAPNLDTSRFVRIIAAAQLVTVGELEFDPHAAASDEPGEWGRVGPEATTRIGNSVLSVSDTASASGDGTETITG